VATQILQGAGPAAVDLNRYNVPLDDIEWKVNLVQKPNESTSRIVLSSPSPDWYVDTVTVSFPRQLATPGMGIVLEEVAGGREDGVGVTVVTGLVEGGAAEGCDIRPGDSLGRVSLVRKRCLGGNNQEEQVFPATTECLNYDSTVEALGALPIADKTYTDTYMVELRRLRMKPKVKVNLQFPPEDDNKDTSIELFAGENLRLGMLVRGVKLNDPLALRFDTKNGGNCGAGGLCRTCSVSIQNGMDLLNPQRQAEKQMLADRPRWRLSCKAIVGFGMQEGEITVRVNPQQW